MNIEFLRAYIEPLKNTDHHADHTKKVIYQKTDATNVG